MHIAGQHTALLNVRRQLPTINMTQGRHHIYQYYNIKHSVHDFNTDVKMSLILILTLITPRRYFKHVLVYLFNS